MVKRAEYRSGFPEFLPSQRAVELAVLDSLRRTFELHGFGSLETSSVEALDRLLLKGETDKEVYALRRLQADASDDGSGLGLHFDLTVPLARYIVDNAGKLEFPFRRYQIQKCWRGERPQEGRFREFTQADIDIIGRDKLPFQSDVEVAAVMAEALSALPVPPLRMQINNRRLMQGFMEGIGVNDVPGAMRAVDRLDKIGLPKLQNLLVEQVGFTEHQAFLCLEFVDIRTEDTSFVSRVRDLKVRNENLSRGLDELEQVVVAATDVASERVTVTADLSIARGLDYYTGTVFETRMRGWERIGSVCSGGRYDSLATDGVTTYPGVGVSLGVTRLLTPLITSGVLDGSRSVPSAVLVALPDDFSRPFVQQVAQALRARGIPTETSPEPSKYGAQIRFAARRGIPYVWFVRSDGEDQVRDVRSGAQFDVDIATWVPPAEDLRPSIVREESSE